MFSGTYIGRCAQVIETNPVQIELRPQALRDDLFNRKD